MIMKEFSKANVERCEAKDGFNHKLGDWSLSDWMTAITGEVGEAANIVKKLNRVRDGIPGNDEPSAVLAERLAGEIADIYIYLDLFAARCGFDLATEVIKAFNAKSEKIGYPVKLATF